jgi:hypothetical protein
MSQEVTVECLDKVTDSCPSNRVRSESVKRPMLAAGVGGALVLAVVSALEARSGARKLNARGMAVGELGARGILVEALPVDVGVGTQELVLVRLRF